MLCDPNSQRGFLALSALLFAAGTALTILWCGSMADIGELPLQGGSTISTAWTTICGRTWPGAAASFLVMWGVMMLAMMLPSLVPILSRYRRTVGGTGTRHLGALTALVGAGYFLIWMIVGMALFPPGAALAEIALRQPALALALPVAAGLMVIGAGLLQFTPWKARHLAACRQAPGPGCLTADAGTALRLGLRLGRHCCSSCAGPTAALLALGIMNLQAMALIAAAIAAERLAPDGQRLARITGAVAIAGGSLMMARAAGLG